MDSKINVLIVDDEYLVRNLLKNCINWEYINMEIVAEAADANEALELVRQYGPDIIITDIYMPIIDGITFSELVLKNRPDTKIVILTGYDDFQYAQRSIRAGVSDYLLKPIDDEEVLRTMTNLKALIDQERRSSQENSKLRSRLYDNLPYLKERFFNELINEEELQHPPLDKMLFLGIQFKYASFQVAVIELNPADGRAGNEHARTTTGEAVLALVHKYFEPSPYTFVFIDSNHRIIILNNDETCDVYVHCELLKGRIIQETGGSVCIGIGLVKREIGEIGKSYKEALEALNYRVIVGNNVIILYNHIDLYNEYNTNDLNNLYNKLGFYIKAGLHDKVQETINEMYGSIDLKDKTVLSGIRNITVSIHLICIRQLSESGVAAEEARGIEGNLQPCFELDTIPDIKRYLKEVTAETIRLINKRQVHKSGNSIDDIKNYIHEHYADTGLSLTQAAKVFYLNPSYLSRTFKKETGTNFIEYLTTVRVEKAISLLKEQDLKAFEIAKAVGISDSNYFSTCFKKYTGISVSDYRKAVKS
ncbi:response regulator [Paenibacillus macerans]|uniref:response regulator n=1 Tax=Paenibacillus macerans TaxID=44252 RepID=UPI003D323047